MPRSSRRLGDYIKQDGNLDVGAANSALQEADPVSWALVDPHRYALASVLTGDDLVALKTLCSQVLPERVIVLNVGTNMLHIVKGLEKDVVTIGELALYLDVDFDALFASLAVVNFDTTHDRVPRELHRLERQATSKARLDWLQQVARDSADLPVASRRVPNKGIDDRFITEIPEELPLAAELAYYFDLGVEDFWARYELYGTGTRAVRMMEHNRRAFKRTDPAKRLF